MLKSFALILMSLALASVSACHSQTSSGEAPRNDAQIAKIAVAAYNIEIEVGKVGWQKASSKEVQDFGETVVRDYTALDGNTTALTAKLAMTPEESETSKTVKSSGERLVAQLRQMSVAEFDKTYIDVEVGYHEELIAAFTTILIPNTKNAELKSLLESAGPIFQSQLEQAKRLQSSLKK